MTLPASQGRSVSTRAPFELMFSVQANSARAGFCPFESSTRNIWSSRLARRSIFSTCFLRMGLCHWQQFSRTGGVRYLP
jgi:hypothetical protein